MQNLDKLMRLVAIFKAVRLSHLIFAGMLGLCAEGSLVGYFAGWQTGLLVALASLVGGLLALHLGLLGIVAWGMRAYSRGNFRVAAVCLGLTQLPRMGRYSRGGKTHDAFHDSKNRAAQELMMQMMRGGGGMGGLGLPR